MRRLASTLLAALLLVCSNWVLATEWEMATPYPADNFHTENILWFCEQLERETGGELKIRVHPNGAKYSHPGIWDAVSSNRIAAGEILMSSRSDRYALLGVDSVPFLANSYQRAERLYRVSRPFFDRRLKESGLIPLFSVPWPPQGMYLSQEIDSIDDLKGLRFRTYNRMTSELAELIGGKPAIIEFRELAAAFGNGQVDAMFTSATSGVDVEAWKFASHFYDLQAWLPRNILVVNAEAFEKLSPRVKETLFRIAREAEQRGLENSRRLNERHKQILQERGMQVITPDPRLSEEFHMAGNALISRWIKRAGQDGAELIADYAR
jgi:TRAP-type C4-dicarboxylate transport system substrate-binding protein